MSTRANNKAYIAGFPAAGRFLPGVGEDQRPVCERRHVSKFSIIYVQSSRWQMVS